MFQNDFTGFVLVGGKSSRMGADKFALKIGGGTFLERAVQTLKPVCETVKIVLSQTQNIKTDLEIIRDIYENRGAPGGIHAAFSNCDTKFAVVLAVDLPLITSDAFERLCTIAIDSEDFSAIVPRQKDNKIQPLAAVYRVDVCLPKVEEILLKYESTSMRSFIETIETNFIEADSLSTDENLFFNVNCPPDFEQIIKNH